MPSPTPADEHGPGSAWFVQALTRRLALLEDSEFVIVWVDVPTARHGSGPYLRLVRAGDELTLEVARNLFQADHRLSRNEQTQLVALGGQPPVAGRDTFWFTGSRAAIAASAGSVLSEGFGVADVRVIGYLEGALDDPPAMPTLSLVHHRAGLRAWADYDDTGALRISGQDLGGGFLGTSEYEYFLTIHPSAFPRLRDALGAPEDVDVRSLVTAYGPDLVRSGEKAWLDRYAIPYDFSSWVSP